MRNFNLLVLGQGLSKEDYPDYKIYIKKTCRYLLEKKLGTSNEYSRHMFSSRDKKNVNLRASKSWLDK